MYIDHAEFQALDQNIMTTRDWIEITDDFLKFNRQGVLKDSGKISHDSAIQKAEIEYEKFRLGQDKKYMSHFDKTTEKYLKGK